MYTFKMFLFFFNLCKEFCIRVQKNFFTSILHIIYHDIPLYFCFNLSKKLVIEYSPVLPYEPMYFNTVIKNHAILSDTSP